jgi:hypothetical protein
MNNNRWLSNENAIETMKLTDLRTCRTAFGAPLFKAGVYRLQ